MHTARLLCAWLILCGLITAHVQANWMTFTGGPAVALGTWPGGSGLSGFATVTASNFVNGNLATPAIGLTPITVGPPLSSHRKQRLSSASPFGLRHQHTATRPVLVDTAPYFAALVASS